MKKGIWVLVLLVGCGGCTSDDPLSSSNEPRVSRCSDFDPLRRAFFGDLHAHTRLSYDAMFFGMHVSIDQAYRFAKGETIPVFPYDEEANPIGRAKLDRPLDFVAITDHADMIGAASTICYDPESAGYHTQYCRTIRSRWSFFARPKIDPETGHPLYCGPDGEDCIAASADAWELMRAEAEIHNDQSPACSFTAFVGFEWTAKPMHRNVIFPSNAVPDRPFTRDDSRRPEDLWQYLKTTCLEADEECDFMTIPHNSNMSKGRAFVPDTDRPLAEFAADSHRFEPLIEIMQTKGSSECLADMTASDEECGFENNPWETSPHSDPISFLLLTGFTPPRPESFVRPGLGRGLQCAEETGVNPFEYGFVASTDTHSATPGQASEDYPTGHIGNLYNLLDPQGKAINGVAFYGSGGLAGIWAEENSRHALFSAMRRKETFGTSGPRIQPRFFGGWSFDESMVDAPDRMKRAYAEGVPMGGRLPPPPSPDSKPAFFACAEQDTRIDHGASVPLQSLEIIKGWLGNNGYQDVRILIAGEEDSPASVDLDTCVPQSNGHGSASLCTVWTDDTFDPSQHAYYYLRVLENPTCRWTTRRCNALEVECSAQPLHQCCDPVLGLNRSICSTVDCERAEAIKGLNPLLQRCCDPFVEATIKERAWTSPIWYVP